MFYRVIQGRLNDFLFDRDKRKAKIRVDNLDMNIHMDDAKEIMRYYHIIKGLTVKLTFQQGRKVEILADFS